MSESVPAMCRTSYFDHAAKSTNVLRNFDEVLRVVDSMQLTAKYKVATPVNWKQGDDVIILPASDDEAKQICPAAGKHPRPYLRIVPQPK